MSILYVGDPHVQVSNLQDSEKLMSFVLSKAEDLKVEKIVLLGDLTHNHAVLRLEVLDFWQKWLNTFSSKYKTVVLCGNHDMQNQHNGSIHALQVFKNINKNLVIVDDQYLDDGYGYLPYIHNHEIFATKAQELFLKGAKKLVCHQTVDGSKYDNGFYAPDGIDPKSLPLFVEVISGHIHTTARIDNWFYTGTAKYDTLSDANQDKGIWHYDKEWTHYSTAGIVSAIHIYEVLEGDEVPELNPSNRNYVVLKGSSAWISRKTKELKGKARISAKPEDSKSYEQRIEKINSMEHYALNYFKFAEKLEPKTVLQYINELK